MWFKRTNGILFFLVPRRNIVAPFFSSSSSSFICKVLETKTVSKDANGASTFRISSGSALLSQIHVDPIGLGTDNINTYIDNFTGDKTRHGSCFKERQWYQ